MAKQIGNLWARTSKNEVPYFSGNIDLGILGEIPIVIFRRTKKEKDTQSDWQIFLNNKYEAAKSGKKDATIAVVTEAVGAVEVKS